MPRTLILRKLGVHRTACFALYRALLRQKHELRLNERQQHLFRKPIRVIFKRNSKLQSPSPISTALQLGYETLEGLQDGVRQQTILNRIFELACPLRTSAQPEDLPSSPQTKTARAQKSTKRYAVPYPGATRTLARPFQNLSGRRHVPVLINANRVPFLRLKKPQPAFLSRIIQDTVSTREGRLTKAGILTSELPIAEDEDRWDRILYEHFGLDYRDPEEKPWGLEITRALGENHKLQREAIKKRTNISAEMFTILEQEKALAEEEKSRIRDEKHKASKARRLARRGLTESEIQEKLYPHSEKIFTRDAPTETEKVPKQDHGARQPNLDLTRRKRGDKYKTPEELKRIYEASLLPKTDEEIAKIKETRARRKEEESRRKAEKRKRIQEDAAFREQQLDNKARHSSQKRRGSENQKDLDERQTDYGSIQQQPELPPRLGELQRASRLAPDRPWRMVKTDQTRSDRPGIFRPS